MDSTYFEAHYGQISSRLILQFWKYVEFSSFRPIHQNRVWPGINFIQLVQQLQTARDEKQASCGCKNVPNLMTNILICSMMVLNKSFSISEWMFMDVCSFIGPYLPTFELNKKSLTGSEKSGSPWAPLFLHFKNILRSCRMSEKYFWNFNFN